MLRAFFVAVMQCAVVDNNRVIRIANCMVSKLVLPCHGTWRCCGTAIYWDLFDTGIKMLVLTILIEGIAQH